MKHYQFCPVCKQDQFIDFLQAKDFTVSGEYFVIKACKACGFRFTQNIPDQQESGRYYASEDYVSHSNTNKTLFFKVYQWVRNYALKSKQRTIQRYIHQPGELLDIGCGTGHFLAEMKKNGWTVTGLEPSEKARKIALETNGISAINPDYLYGFSENKFQVISMWHVLEHVHTLEEYIQQIFKILDDSGIFIIAVPNSNSYDAKYYREYWAAYDVPRHLYHFVPETMKLLAEKKGFKMVGIHPMWFDAFYVSMLSEQCKNKSKIRGLIYGFLSNIHALTNKCQTSSLIYVLQKKRN